MEKLLTFPGAVEGDIFVQAITPSTMMEKTASVLHSDVLRFVDSIKTDPKKLYVLVNALGSGEFYGSNVNGDYFEEDQLLGLADKYKDLDVYPDPYGYKTFENGGIYRHHVNKDPKRSMGKVVLSVFNPRMHRVELILCIDRDRASQLGHTDLVQTLDKGGHPAVSMGCRVKYDICSVCGHKSKTRADYCPHARGMMGQILSDGRKVFVYNPRPRFFDISFVVIGADKTSYAMTKLANTGFPLSADAAWEAGIKEASIFSQVKTAKKEKLADLLKKVPVSLMKIDKSILRERPIPKALLKRASQHKLSTVLTTTAALGIVLRPEEYQEIVLTKLGNSSYANGLNQQNRVFTPSELIDDSVIIGNIHDLDKKLACDFASCVEDRSAFEPFITKRVLTTGSSNINIPSRSFENNRLLEKVSAAYNGYRTQLLMKIASIVQEITQQPDMLLLLGDNTFEDELIYGDRYKRADAQASLLGLFPLAHLYGAYVKGKRSIGKEATAVDNFIESHPTFAASMAMGLARLGMALSKGAL